MGSKGPSNCDASPQNGTRLSKKTPKRPEKAKLHEDRMEATGSNDVWSLDFVHHQLATGRKVRASTFVDTLSRYVPVPDQRFS